MPHEPVGFGCEGAVAAVTLAGGHRLRVKRFQRRSELERSIIGAALLRRCLLEQGWESLVLLPRVVAVDLDRLVVVTTPFVEPPPGSAPDWLIDARSKATTAAYCAGGLAAALTEAAVRRIVGAAYGDMSPGLTRFWFEGVALNDTSLLTDGRRWILVDF